MLFGICAVIGAVLADNGGFQEATKALASVTGDAGWQGAYTAFLGPDPLALLFVVILTSLGTWGCHRWSVNFMPLRARKIYIKERLYPQCLHYCCRSVISLEDSEDCMQIKVTINPATGKPLFDTIVPTMLSTLPALVIAWSLCLYYPHLCPLFHHWC